MTPCSDPLLIYLKNVGYSIVRIPKADVKPLQILWRQGDNLERLGELTTVLSAGSTIPLPTIHEDIPLANLSGNRTSDLKMGIGLSLLGSILGAMGWEGQSFELHEKYREAKTITFEFHKVVEDRVELAKLDQYLTDADVSPFSNYVGTLLDADEIYVTTATIKSQRFTVEAKKSNGAGLELSIPEIQGVVKGNVRISGRTAMASRITYEGNEPLVFGFQAVQLCYDDGRYKRFETLRPGDAGMRGDTSAATQSKPLISEGPFLRVHW